MFPGILQIQHIHNINNMMPTNGANPKKTQ